MAGYSATVLQHGGDTIAAVATPNGRSATSLIRVSGDDAVAIVSRILHAELPPPRTAKLLTIHPVRGEQVLERALITWYRAPASYTGEDVVEISTHGGVTVPTLVMEQLIEAGARLAFPGEFTRRALLNGKLDLLQAEAVGDLIDSRSRGAAAAAMSQLDGNLSRRIMELRSAVIHVEALIAYDIDFPEEDDGPIDSDRVAAACDDIIARLESLAATADVGELVLEGAVVVIAGTPNAGKSSLFNALVGRRKSLVTDIPGTTRDAIEAVVDVPPWTLRLVDTAGLRDSIEVVERLGIEVAEEYLAKADLVLVCGDSDETLQTALDRTLRHTTAPVVAVHTKSDLRPVPSSAPIQARSDTMRLEIAEVDVSAVSGAGISTLLRIVGEILASRGDHVDINAPLLLRARHRRSVLESASEMRLFLSACQSGDLPMSVAATHLRSAGDALEVMIGGVGVEDILDRLFSTFCVGK